MQEQEKKVKEDEGDQTPDLAEPVPRRPGVYPRDYPIERILQTAPIPGQALSRPSTSGPAVKFRTEHQVRSRELRPPDGSESKRRSRRNTTRPARLQLTVLEFPPLTSSPPIFKKNNVHEYPSRVRSGLAFYPHFMVKLWELNSEVPLDYQQ
jgi:hypothetical protein